MTHEPQFRLIENALDYVLSAGEHVQSDTPRDLKYAALHLFAGVELLLKARLQLEHWSLLFADVDKASQEHLRSGNLRTVEFDALLKRLQSICGHKLNDKVKAELINLRDLRNRIQHFDLKMKTPQVRSMLGVVANFVVDFVADQLGKNLEAGDKKIIQHIRKILAENEEYTTARLESLRPRLEHEKYVVECRYCFQKAVVIEIGKTPTCLFCGEWEPLERCASDLSETGEAYICPKCGKKACAAVVFIERRFDFQCLACGVELKGLHPCMYCGENLITREKSVCDDCNHTLDNLWKEE